MCFLNINELSYGTFELECNCVFLHRLKYKQFDSLIMSNME